MGNREQIGRELLAAVKEMEEAQSALIQLEADHQDAIRAARMRAREARMKTAMLARMLARGEG